MAIPFDLANLIKATPANKIVDEDLLNARKTFGIDDKFLLKDYTDYYKDAPSDEDKGLASLETGLPFYVQDNDGGNNFLQYSDEGAPAFIKPTSSTNNQQLSQGIGYENFMNSVRDDYNEFSKSSPDFVSFDDYYQQTAPLGRNPITGKAYKQPRTIADQNRILGMTFSEPNKSTGILQNIKDGGSKLLDFIKGGGIMGNVARGLIPEQDPRAAFMRNYYGGQDGSNIKDGTIQSGLMAGYNPVSGGLLNMLTGGRFGEPTTYGLQNAYDRRIKAIQNTLLEKYGDPNYKGKDTKLDERLEKLREEKRKEAEAAENARQAAIEELNRKKAEAKKAGDAARARKLQIEAAAKTQGISRRQAEQQQAAVESERGTPGSSDFGNVGGTSGAMTSSNQGFFCFDPSTPIQMADGSEKKIKEIQLGDQTKGGEVTGVFQFKASDEIHDYKGVTVAGSHYVKEDGKFIMVKDSPLSVKIDKIPVVYSLDTTGRRIFIKDIEFADYNGDGIAKGFLANAGVDITGFDKEVLRQVENRLI